MLFFTCFPRKYCFVSGLAFGFSVESIIAFENTPSPCKLDWQEVHKSQ